jgi:hypothetical protein
MANYYTVVHDYYMSRHNNLPVREQHPLQLNKTSQPGSKRQKKLSDSSGSHNNANLSGIPSHWHSVTNVSIACHLPQAILPRNIPTRRQADQFVLS